MKFRFLSCVLGTLALLAGLTAQAQDANLRLVHLAPFADTEAGTSVTVTVTLQGSTTGAALTVPNVQYEDFTNYAPFTPGTYIVDVTPTGGSDPALSGEVVLAADTDYTVAVIGNGDTQDLGFLLLEDNNRAPEEGFVRLRAAHVAPFAADVTNTAVDIRDGTEVVLDDLLYEQVSDFGRTSSGTLNLTVTNSDGSTVLIEPQPFEVEAGYIATIFVIGDDVNQPLRLFVLSSDPENTFSGILQVTTTCTTGSWFQPSTDGQGFNFEAIPSQNRMIGYWYTFSQNGDEQVWYYMDGSFNGTGNAANLTVFKRTGASFNQGVANPAEAVGTLDVTFTSTTDATAAFNVEDPGTVTANGTQDLTRLTPIPEGACEGFVGFEPAAEPAPEPEPEPETVICVVNEEDTEVVIENVECEDGSDVGSACTVTIESETFQDVTCTAVNP